ncbi:hypothetical protein RY831_08380 [Noviherbaspirillum sp. CPCC 100848]|uniref:Uncharacterized protein n=1 Tax=Noviherbaspirillum album TaxID=3080276 RepID=A0ABU6J678_9BURK|nr:hypothetical protein [Noviherbaspirillum sp. CPCC 100848]MEC4719162.1 hypothetical protein [Noviherbaspirillum sp. CPCC 100848]
MKSFKASMRPWMSEDLEPFGTITLDSGETVDRVYLAARLDRFPSQHGMMKH